MAKATFSPLNNWRGRAGGQVYRVRNGQQIVSAYQAAVANPKTDAQMMQRTKFNLMTKLNAMFDTRLLNGFSSSKGIARAMFSKKIMPSIYAQKLTAPDGSKFRANIAPANIVFGPNAENYIIPTQSVSSHIQLAAAGTVARLTFTALSNLFSVDSAVARIRFVDVFGDSNFQYSEVMVNDLNGEIIDDVAATIDFAGVGVHRVYLQILNPDNSTLNDFRGGSVDNDDLDPNIVVADSGANFASSLTVGGSYYIGSVEVSA